MQSLVKRVSPIHLMLLSVVAFSGVLTAGGGAMPWDAGLAALTGNISGPFAGFVALMAVVISGGVLIFGGELQAVWRTIFFVVLVAGLILGAAQIIALVGGGAAGAVLPIDPLATVGG